VSELSPVSSDETDIFSINLVIVIRLIRNFAAGLVNLVFPFVVLNEMHESLTILGLIYAAGTLATAAFGLLVGFTTDYSRKATYIFALALLPLSTLIIYISQNILAVSLAALIGGFSATGSLAGGGVGGSVQPVQTTVISDITSRKDRSFYYGLLSFIAGVSSAFGALAGGYITTSQTFFYATILGIASTIPALFVRTKASTEEKRFTLKSGKIIGKFGITGLLNGLSNGLVTPFLIPFFIVTYGITRDSMGIYTTIAGLIGACTFLLAPRMERILGFVKGVIMTRGATIVLMAFFPFVQILPFSIGIYLAYPALRVAAFPVIQTAMVDMVHEGERGRLFGVSQATRLTMSSAGTSFAGYELDSSAIPVPFIAYCVVLALNLALYSRFFSEYDDPLRAHKKQGKNG
jgi:MFS family permease